MAFLKAQSQVFASPLEHMTHSEKTQYFNLALQILETMTECNKSDNYLGISSEDVMQILGGIEKRALFENFEENSSAEFKNPGKMSKLVAATFDHLLAATQCRRVNIS